MMWLLEMHLPPEGVIRRFPEFGIILALVYLLVSPLLSLGLCIAGFTM